MLPVLRGARPLGFRVQGLAIGFQGLKGLTHRVTSMSAASPASKAPQEALRISTYPSFHNINRAMSTKPPLQPKGINKEAEKEIAGRTLEARPEEVTTSSSVRKVLESSQAPAEENPDVMEGLKSDLETVKDTFALRTVPHEAYVLGLAGTLPYLATSLSTMYLSWNLNTTWHPSNYLLNSLFLQHGSAEHWLQLLEPIQVGYGAVIISFLGAIHWGLEFAEKRAPATKEEEDRKRVRYAIGVLAPAMAWPTIFMPVEWALTTQFAAFTALYFNDSRAAVKGWAPPWYSTYRFVLTAVVGTAILVSLVGRAKVGEGHTRLSTAELRDRIQGRGYGGKGDQYRNWGKEEAEERERLKEEKRVKEEEERKAKEEEEKKKKEQEEKQTKEGKGKQGKKETKVKGANSGDVKDKQQQKAEAKEGGKTEDKLEEKESSEGQEPEKKDSEGKNA